MTRSTQQNITRPPFVADPKSGVRMPGKQIDWDRIPESYRQGDTATVTVGSAGAAIDDTTVPVDALTVAMPVGTLLDFGGKKTARLTAPAAVGATSITVSALAAALVDNDVATYMYGRGAKLLKAGTVVGNALTSGGAVSLRVVTTNPAIGILETDAIEGAEEQGLTGQSIIVGGVFYENLLPEATGSPAVLASAVKTELNANGSGFAFVQYADNRS